MQRLFLYTFGVLIFLTIGLFVIPLAISAERFKPTIEAMFKNYAGVELTVNGAINYQILPIPEVTLNTVNIANLSEKSSSLYLANIQKVVLKPDYKKLFLASFSINSISFDQLIIEFEKHSDGTNNWQAHQNNFLTAIESNSLDVLKNIQFNLKNSTILYRTDEKLHSLDYFYSTISINPQSSDIIFKGTFEENAVVLKYSGDLNISQPSKKLNLNINSEPLNIAINSTNEHDINSSVLKGSLKADSPNLSLLTSNFFNKNSFLSEVTSTEKLELTSDIELSSDIWSIKNTELSSPNINGKGTIDALIDKDDQSLSWDVSFDFDTINMDMLTKKDSSLGQLDNNDDYIDYYQTVSAGNNWKDINLNIANNFSAAIRIGAQKIIYNKQNITNTICDIEFFKGTAKINQFMADLPGKSTYEFSGDIDHNGIRPLVTGNLAIKGKSLRDLVVWLDSGLDYIPQGEMNDFSVDTEIELTPEKFNFNKINISFDRTNINANMVMRPNEQVPHIKLFAELDRFNFDQYGFTPHIYKHFDELILKAKDVDLDTSSLKTTANKVSLSLSASDVVMNDNAIKGFNVNLSIRPGVLAVQKLQMQSELVKAKGSFNLNLVKNKPTINLNVQGTKLDTQFFSYQEDNKPTNTSEENAETSVKASPSKPKQRWAWSKKSLNLLGLYRFDGTANIKFDELVAPHYTLNDLELAGELGKQVIKITEAKTKFIDGTIKLEGNIGVGKLPSFALSYALTKVRVADLLKAIGIRDPAIEGHIFAAGRAQTIGKTPHAWVNNLTSSTKFNGQQFKIIGFNLNKIIASARQLYSVIDMEKVIKSSLYEGQFVLDTIEGILSTQKGILQAKDVKMKTTYTRGAFAGNLSLNSFNSNGRSQFSFSPERGKVVAITLDLKGPVGTIEKQLNTSQLEKYITDKSVN